MSEQTIDGVKAGAVAVRSGDDVRLPSLLTYLLIAFGIAWGVLAIIRHNTAT